MVYDVVTSRLFQLNRTAARAWCLLRDGQDDEAVVHDLARAHAADPMAVRRDLAAFVAALREAALLGAGAGQEPLLIARARPPAGAPALDAVYRVDGVSIRVVCHPAAVALAFEPLAAPARAPDGTPGAACLTLHREGAAFVLARDGLVLARLAGAPAARWAMGRELVSAGRQRPWLALLHAGAVAGPTGCLMLCGDSGAGKSTLLAALLHAGFRLVADDILPLERETGLVRPVRLAVSIKRGSWPAIGALFPALATRPIVRLGSRRMRFLWPGDEGAVAEAAGFRPTAVLFPRHVDGAPAVLTPQDPVRALVRLGEGGSILPDTDAGLAEFLGWWSRIPAYELSYGRLDEAIREASTLLPMPGEPRVPAAGAAVT